MSVNKKLDETDYDIWSLKVQLLLNNGDIVEFLTATMFVLTNKDKHGTDVTASKQYQEKLKANQAWFTSNLSAHYTLLLCTYDDLLGEFERCPTTNDMWD